MRRLMPRVAHCESDLLRMNAPIDPTLLTADRFAVGQPVSRKEDPVLLRGMGRYTDDLNRPGQLYGVMVRSRVAHGMLRSLDIDQARDMAGVHLIVTARDLERGGIKTMPAAAGKNRDGSPTPRPPQPPLATDRVRYVGEPIAMVVAETIAQAKDAAEVVFADIDSLPAVTTASEATTPNAPQLHDDAPGNVCLDYHYGDSEQVATAFERAAHVTQLPLRNSRIVVCPMEPRSAIGEYEPDTDRLALRLGCQGVFGQRNLLSGILGVPVEKLRILTGNVGGSFGMKASAYPEYICLLYAARELDRPVKWRDERSDSFLSDSHGRDHEMTAELALDASGKFLALRVTGYGNLGAWLSNATTYSADTEHSEEHHRRLCHATDRSVIEMHVHQHHASWRLSRCGTSGRQLLYGTLGGDRGARNGHRPRRTAPTQPHPATADAISHAIRHAVRQR